MKYHKINTIYKRHETTKKIIEGDWSDEVFRYLSANLWTFSEKIDGTNIRVYYEDGRFEIKGRTDKAELPRRLVDNITTMFNNRIHILKRMFDNQPVIFYGEGCGPKIQKDGHLYRPDQGLVIFDIFIGKWWITRDNLVKICQDLGFDVAPFCGVGTLFDAIQMVKGMFKSNFGDFQAEGVIAVPTTNLLDRGGRRIITKIKCRDFK